MNYTEFEEIEDQNENEQDLGGAGSLRKSSAVVWGSDWTTETILAQITKGNFSLDPSFQRRDAWTKERKSKFIESLILGLPVPQIVLAESQTKKGSFIVLDGKQRLLAIRQFASSPNDPYFEELKLTGLEILVELNGKSFQDMKTDLFLIEEVTSFENQPIRATLIKNWPDEQFLYHVFLRLNTGSVALSPQELRQALHPGKFVRFVDDYSINSQVLKRILNNPKPDFRMRDAELFLRFIAFKTRSSEYSGSLKEFLDQTCSLMNNDWKKVEADVLTYSNEFEKAYAIIENLFSNPFKKWNGSNYEKFFNRAIFDVLMSSFTEPELQNAIIGREHEVEDLFKEICLNVTFLNSIGSTTKSVRSVRDRFGIWYQAVNKKFGTNISIDLPSSVD